MLFYFLGLCKLNGYKLKPGSVPTVYSPSKNDELSTCNTRSDKINTRNNKKTQDSVIEQCLEEMLDTNMMIAHENESFLHNKVEENKSLQETV